MNTMIATAITTQVRAALGLRAIKSSDRMSRAMTQVNGWVNRARTLAAKNMGLLYQHRPPVCVAWNRIGAMPKRLTPHGVPLRKSRVDTNVVRAYRNTRYGVDAATPFAVYVGQASGPLQCLMAQHHCHSAAYITACNPTGRCLADGQNARRQATLANFLRRSGYEFLQGQGQGQGANTHWTAEPSFLVLGMPLQAAKAVGRRWRQNAILWCGADAVPQLVFMR